MPRLAQIIRNGPLFPGRGAPGGPLILFARQQEKMKGSISTTVLVIVQEKGSTVLIIVQISVDFCLSLFRLLLNFVFHKLMLVI